ncbi:MAG: FecR domain-containing protein [Candidatus Omnitrophica bacterium]|nr:FecR domain-containing protein [Candidatus Omnitrophota bacterium]
MMSLEGSAVLTKGGITQSLKVGDLLKAGDTVEVRSGYLDLAYDTEWKNVTRILGKSKVKIRSIYPTQIGMERGGILAKLRRLPKGSTFEVQTPTATAAVRGSEYFTEHREGVTRVMNFSPSPVMVFGAAGSGKPGDRTVVEESKKTEVSGADGLPKPPEKLSGEEVRAVRVQSESVDAAVEQCLKEGRVGKTQEIDRVEYDLLRKELDLAKFDMSKIEDNVERLTAMAAEKARQLSRLAEEKRKKGNA